MYIGLLRCLKRAFQQRGTNNSKVNLGSKLKTVTVKIMMEREN